MTFSFFINKKNTLGKKKIYFIKDLFTKIKIFDFND